MKQQYFDVMPMIRQLLMSACVAGLLLPHAMAQGMGDSRAAAGVDASSATALPTITNMRPDIRQQPNSSAARPARIAGGGKGPFESYAQTVTGQELKIFGKGLFNDVPSTFAPFDGAQVNPDYVIGSGDELQIRGWGMVDIDISATVDRSGAIYIPRVGSIKVAGIQYRDLQGYLKKAISRIFNNFELTASIAQTRAVQIYVVGHAVRPGTYTLSAMSTLLNALFTFGGPDASGSMRNIQVKRGGDMITSFDLYDMLVKGDKSRDVSLRDGDVIYIPDAGPLVALTGNVKQPAIFELKGTASLADVVSWAGGFDSAAESKQVIIEKSVENNYQTVAELVAEKSAIATRLANIPVRATDILRVFAPGAVPVQAQIRNEYVRVSGEVVQTGVFQLRKDETLRELLARIGGVTDNAYVFATQVHRESVRRGQQVKLDEVADRFERDLDTSAAQRLAGSTDKDNVAIISAEVERQRRLAQRLRSIKAEGRIVLELPGPEAQLKNLPDLVLRDGDSVSVPRKPGTVDVMGAVFQQNAFIFRPSRTVGDYLALAGGSTATADPAETYLIRADGTAQSGRSKGWLGGVNGSEVGPGDTIVVPEKIERSSWTQSFKEWTGILYQFGLGAAGLKVLKN